MIRTRVIPALLLKGRGFVKTTKFMDPVYLGDPINIVRIFNEKYVDEICILDISASPSGQNPDFEILEDIAGECFMPLSYGGGLRTVEDIRKILSAGFEKAVVNTVASKSPQLVHEASQAFGSQSVVVSIDVKRTIFGRYEVYVNGGKEKIGEEPVSYAKMMEELGAGEILLNSIDRDGTMSGYDLDLIAKVSEELTIPLIACGGAGRVEDLADAVHKAGASAVAAGAFFVFHGPHRAVLINMPTQAKIEEMLP